MPTSPKFWNSNHRLVLASRSEARRNLLASAGIPFAVDVAEVDERTLETSFLGGGGAAEKLPGLLARAKALEVSRRWPGFLCIGADQVLTLDGRVFHKAKTLGDAASQLASLSGRTHRLTSAFAITKDGVLLHDGEDHADMTMRSLSAAQIELYLDTVGDVALTTVGAYQAEGLGVHIIEKIRGDHSTILGLPLFALLSCLRREGALAL